jgi:DNA-binding IclR family transcriptional regulator
MIQVLQRAATILSSYKESPETPKGVTELAGLLKVKTPTCANILRTLVDLGYLTALPNKKGYILGPEIYSLAQHGSFKKSLVDRALPSLQTLSKKLKETTILSALSGDEKIVLCQVEANQNIQVNADSVANSDVYSTATGRLLVAHLEETDLAKIVKKHGFPGAAWNQIRTLEGFKEASQAIRKQGYSIVVTSGEIVGIGFPIFEAGTVVAALGLYLPEHRFKDEHKKSILLEMQKTAQQLSLSKK